MKRSLNIVHHSHYPKKNIWTERMSVKPRLFLRKLFASADSVRKDGRRKNCQQPCRPFSWRWLQKFVIMCPLSNHDHPDRFANGGIWQKKWIMFCALNAVSDTGSYGGNKKKGGVVVGWDCSSMPAQLHRTFFFLVMCIPPTTAQSLFQSESGVCCVGPDSKPDCQQCFQKLQGNTKKLRYRCPIPVPKKEQSSKKQTRARKKKQYPWLGSFFLGWDVFLWEVWGGNDVFDSKESDEKYFLVPEYPFNTLTSSTNSVCETSDQRWRQVERIQKMQILEKCPR